MVAAVLAARELVVACEELERLAGEGPLDLLDPGTEVELRVAEAVEAVEALADDGCLEDVGPLREAVRAEASDLALFAWDAKFAPAVLTGEARAFEALVELAAGLNAGMR